jgi:hypothetical protein
MYNRCDNEKKNRTFNSVQLFNCTKTQHTLTLFLTVGDYVYWSTQVLAMQLNYDYPYRIKKKKNLHIST